MTSSSMQKSASTPGLASSNLPRVDFNAIPSLPGMAIDPKLRQRRFPRLNTWSMVGGCRIERDRDDFLQKKGKFIKAPKNRGDYRQGSLPRTMMKNTYHEGSVGE